MPTCPALLWVVAIVLGSGAATPSSETSDVPPAEQAAPAVEGLQGVLPASAPDLLVGLERLQAEVAAAPETPDWRTDVAMAQADLARLYAATRPESPEPLSAEAQSELLEKLLATQLRIRDAAGGVEGEPAAELREFRYRFWRRRTLLEASFEALETGSKSLDEMLAADRRQLADRLAALRQTLAGTANGEAWMRYLNFEQVEALAAPTAAEPVPADVIVLAERFDASKLESAQRVALERPEFSAVHEALVGYAADLGGRDPALAQQLRDVLREAFAAVDAYENDRSLDQAAQVRELEARLAAIAAGGQTVAQALREAYQQPNLWVAVSRVMASRYLPGAQRERGPVRMQRGGTYVSGEQETRATPRLRFYDARPATFDFELPGTVDSQIVASQGQANVAANIRSTFLASRRIQVTQDGLRPGRPNIDVRASSYVRDADVRGTLFPGIASRRAAEIGQQELNRSEPETEQRVAREVLDRFNPEVDGFVERANRRIDELRERYGKDDESDQIETRSTEHWLLVDGTLADRSQLGAWAPHLSTPPGTLAALAVHETAVNYALGRSDLAGKTYSRDELRTKLRDAIASVAEVEKEETPAPSDEKPLSITFADEGPARVTLRHGTLELVIRATALEGESFQVGPRQVRVRYRVVLDDQNVRLVRQGEIEIDPLTAAGNDPDAASLPALREVLEEIFPAESTRSRTFDASLGDEKKKLDLRVLGVDVEDGWLAVGVGD